MVKRILFCVVGGLAVLCPGSEKKSVPAEELVARGLHPGFVSIYAGTNGVAHTNICGWANAARKEPMTARTMFWTASMTKGFTGALFAQLCAEGKMSPDDSSARYFPGLADLKVTGKGKVSAAPTLRQLLSHTAGLPFKTPEMREKGTECKPMSYLAENVQNLIELHHQPGETNVYGNLGIDLAAACMEKATGKSYERMLKERFFDPLEMTDATFFPTEEQCGRLAACYKTRKNKPFTAGAYPPGRAIGKGDRPRNAEAGGGLYMTAGDMFKFYWMLAHGGVGQNGARVLSPRAIELLRTKQTPSHLSYSYSFGFTVSDEGKTIGHGGMLRTYGAADVDTGVCRVWFVQLENKEPLAVRRTVWNRYK